MCCSANARLPKGLSSEMCIKHVDGVSQPPPLNLPLTHSPLVCSVKVNMKQDGNINVKLTNKS